MALESAFEVEEAMDRPHDFRDQKWPEITINAEPHICNDDWQMRFPIKYLRFIFAF